MKVKHAIVVKLHTEVSKCYTMYEYFYKDGALMYTKFDDNNRWTLPWYSYFRNMESMLGYKKDKTRVILKHIEDD